MFSSITKKFAYTVKMQAIRKSLSMISLMLFSSYISSAAKNIDSSPRSTVDELKTLVDINSGTANVMGVDKIQSLFAANLKSLGFDVEINPERLLIATKPGTDVSPRIITLIVHADTVFEPSSHFQKFELSSDGRTAKGPGVIDDKGGIVVVLEGLRRYFKAGLSPFTIRVVSSPSEETGSPGISRSFQNLARDAWMVLGFEPSLDDGSIIESRRGDRWYHIEVTGKEAHAGRAHKDGLNACDVLAAEIHEISKLTDYSQDVTVSVGHIEGGKDKFNIVCGNAQAKIDARFSTLEARDHLHQQIKSILDKEWVAGAITKFDLADDCPPFTGTVSTGSFKQKYLRLLQEIEKRDVTSAKSGGAADSNYFSREGIIILDGLGPTGGKMHTIDEYLVVSSLDTRAEALSRFLRSLGRN